MKITNLAIIFFLVALAVMIPLTSKTNNYTAMTQKKIEYNRALDESVDDAILSLVEFDSKREICLNRTSGLSKFYNSLYANFGALDNPYQQQMLRTYIPVILVTFTDGYYLLYSDLENVNGENKLVQKWTEKLPYSFEDDDCIYSFTLNNYLKIYDKNANEIVEGTNDDLSVLYPDSFLKDDIEFDVKRRAAIIDAIEKSMRFYINHHNKVASHFGVNYDFTLPVIKNDDWNRTIDDISMLVLFQGYPYGYGTHDTYNRYAFGASRIKKKNAYYISEDSQGNKIYHKSTCSQVVNTEEPFYSKKECALEGAYACQECNP